MHKYKNPIKILSFCILKIFAIYCACIINSINIRKVYCLLLKNVYSDRKKYVY